MKQQFKNSAQAGFTLIELIVVIVILGILAATALPKFMGMGGDARVATLSAAVGSIRTTNSLVHGRWLINPSATQTLEDITVNVDATSGYPTASANLALAAGLNADDFTIQAPGVAATANNPATTANQIAIIPASVTGTARGLNCSVVITQPTTLNGLPTYSTMPDADDC
jgi:MSHA pilin protein MshA